MFIVFLIDYSFLELLCRSCIMAHMGQTLFALIVQNASYEQHVIINENGRSYKMFSLQTAGGKFPYPGLTGCFCIIIFSF